MTHSMFPTIFILVVISMGILYLTAARIFQARREKKENLFKESVQDWKNFYRKMGPADGMKFLEKRGIHNSFFKVCTDAELEAISQMMDEWFPERKEENRVH